MTLRGAVVLVLGLTCVTGLAGAQEAEAPEKPRIAIQTAAVPGLKVHYLNIPWGPETFATMERPEGTFYNRRSWPFARLENEFELTLDGQPIVPGNYALVFHPNDATNRGMSLEVLRIDLPEFLQPGNVMTPTPAGESVLRAPVRFDTTTATAPALTIELTPAADGMGLEVRYGNRRLAKRLFR